MFGSKKASTPIKKLLRSRDKPKEISSHFAEITALAGKNDWAAQRCLAELATDPPEFLISYQANAFSSLEQLSQQPSPIACAALAHLYIRGNYRLELMPKPLKVLKLMNDACNATSEAEHCAYVTGVLEKLRHEPLLSNTFHHLIYNLLAFQLLYDPEHLENPLADFALIGCEMAKDSINSIKGNAILEVLEAQAYRFPGWQERLIHWYQKILAFADTSQTYIGLIELLESFEHEQNKAIYSANKLHELLSQTAILDPAGAYYVAWWYMKHGNLSQAKEFFQATLDFAQEPFVSLAKGDIASLS